MSDTTIKNIESHFFTIPEAPIAYTGLTKREYFAAMALQGVLSDSKTIDYLGRMKLNPETFAVKQADALIAELNKEQK